jgi:hypothetical protein
MPQRPSALDESSQPSIDAPKSLGEYIKNTLINTVPPLIAYYGLRSFDVTQYLALVGAIVVATAQGLLTMVRKRKFEPLNGLVLVAAACSLTIAFCTKNPRMVQVVELVPVTLIVWSLTASGLLRRPTSLQFAGAIVPSLADNALPQRGWTQHDIQDWHHLHTRISVRLGLLCSVFPFVATILIFTLPVDFSQVLIVATGTTLLIVCISTAIAWLRRFVQRRDQMAAQRAARPADAYPEHA